MEARSVSALVIGLSGVSFAIKASRKNERFVTLSLFEVFKRICQQRDEDEAVRAIAVMEQGKVVDLDRATALEAARLSLLHRIPMADSIMLATAQRHGAALWTQDSDFAGVQGVRYFAKRD